MKNLMKIIITFKWWVKIFYSWLKNNWNKLYIRKNEFHSSLDLSMLYMNEKERERYMVDLIKRRNVAHNRDLNNSKMNENYGNQKS